MKLSLIYIAVGSVGLQTILYLCLCRSRPRQQPKEEPVKKVQVKIPKPAPAPPETPKGPRKRRPPPTMSKWYKK